MIRVESSVVVDRPAEEVGQALVDVDRMTRWTDMTVSRKLTEGAVRKGTQGYAEVAMGPVKLGWTWELTTFDPQREVAFTTISKSAFSMDGRYRLSSHGASATQVDAIVEVRTRGLLRLLEPMFRAEITRGETAELERLKAFIEAPAKPSET